MNERSIIFRALDESTDRSWSPLNIFRLTGSVHPSGLTPGEATVCKVLSLVLSSKDLPPAIQILYGPEAREVYEEAMTKLKS